MKKISTIFTAVIVTLFVLWVVVKPLFITVIQPNSVGILSNLGDIDPKPLMPGSARHPQPAQVGRGLDSVADEARLRGERRYQDHAAGHDRYRRDLLD